MSDTASPAERLKRLLGQTTRAIAADPDAELRFGGDKLRVTGSEARIPVPPRRLDLKKLAISRGQADGAALRLAHHDEALHARLAPTNNEGAAIHAALEDMRIEALGAQHLEGVGDNLAAALEKSLEDRGYSRMEDRQDVPLADIVALLARERMTGRAVPEPARDLVDLWRAEIEGKAGKALDALTDPEAVIDQSAYAELVRHILDDLGLNDEAGKEEPKEDEEESEQPAEEETEPDGEDDDNDGKDDQPQDESQENVPELGEARDGRVALGGAGERAVARVRRLAEIGGLEELGGQHQPGPGIRRPVGQGENAPDVLLPVPAMPGLHCGDRDLPRHPVPSSPSIPEPSITRNRFGVARIAAAQNVIL